ncbi:MAG: XTP/dITP diphosphohydrolase [Candidatus Midichloriaceae bacterium]|jgi:XTP/dITP diphosphohydrolase
MKNLFIKKKLCIASTNNNKCKEFEAIFQEFGIEVLGLKELNISVLPPEETGSSFLDNAKIKAEHYFKLTNIPTLSDDSGFCIPKLENRPGIFSARWAGAHDNYSVAFDKIKEELKSKGITKFDNIDAFFHCSLVLYINETNIISSAGEVSGKLNFDNILTNGFGYDTLFIPNGYKQTFAEMDPQEKNLVSHRRKATNNLIKKLNEL